MSKAVIARMQGDDYQALYFWYKACGLFHPHSKVKTISYEYDLAKSFDDVVIEYNESIADEYDRLIDVDFFQIKFHVAHSGEMTFASLIDPSFINAKSISFLQRLQDAVVSMRSQGKECRFYLVTPWGIPAHDPLADLVSHVGGELRLDKLMEGKTDQSRMGKVRKLWREHLGLTDDNDLLPILKSLRLFPNSGNTKDLIEKTNYGLISIGLKPVEEGTVTNKYIDMIKGLLKKGRFSFTKEELLEKCKIEGLLGVIPTEKDQAINLGIRSFPRWAENMENETDSMLCLTKYFDGRYLKDAFSWESNIMLDVTHFIKTNVVSSNSYNLHLDTHLSVAFAAGYVLDVKSGIRVGLVQRGYNGRKEIWRPTDLTLSEDYMGWVYKETNFEKGNDVAVAIAASHDNSEDVIHFIKEEDLPIGRLITCFIDGKGPGPTSVEDANHASFLANRIATKIRSRNISERLARLHIFYAGPSALMFFIGQLAHSFGSCTLYEYDFTKQIPGGYQPSITFPYEERVIV